MRQLFSNLSRTALKKARLETALASPSYISARSPVITPPSMVSITAFSRRPAKADRSFSPSSSPRYLSAPVQAKMVATGLVEVSSPLRYR